MIFYFVRKYVLLWIVLILGFTFTAVIIAGIPPQVHLPTTVFWGGLLAAGQLYREFRKKKIWPLYDNLRISKVSLCEMHQIDSLLGFRQ